MISVIVCTRNNRIPQELAENILNTISVGFELIPVINSDNRYSIFEAYNEGIRKSTKPYLVFVHDDVEFKSEGWGQKIITHLDKPGTGICGLAGRDYLTKVPSFPSNKLSASNIIQSDKTGIKAKKHRLIPKDNKEVSRQVVFLDGVLLCMKRELTEKIGFDETIGGFHGYDYDICMQAFAAGYDNYVMYDIMVEHFSRGNLDKVYLENLIRVFKKWENHLPMIARDVNNRHSKKMYRYTLISLRKLPGRMFRRGFSFDEVYHELVWFILNTGHSFTFPIFIVLKIMYFFRKLFHV
jgi:GT2 family glycosyltransferase